MKIFEYIDRVNLLHKLIRDKKTGSPDELAKRINLSKSRLLRIIEDLRLKGVPIAYSRQSKTYYYIKPYQMQIDMSFTTLNQDEIKEVNGGLKIFENNLFNAFFVH